MSTHFSRTLSLLRQEKKINQRTASQALGISQALMSHYETGAREPGIAFILKACDYYGVTADFMLGRSLLREGNLINTEELYDSSLEKGNRLTGGSAAALLGKKLIVNAINIIFDIAGRTGNKNLVKEILQFFSCSIYKIFRHLYQQLGDNPDKYFPTNQTSSSLIANSGMSIAEANIVGILSNKKEDISSPSLSNDSLQKEYPALIQSLLTVLHQATDSK